VRADNGIDISNENPSLVPGGVGACGLTSAEPAVFDLDWVPMASFFTAGVCQARREVPLELIGRIIRLQNNHVHKRSMGSGPAWQDWRRARRTRCCDDKSAAKRFTPRRENSEGRLTLASACIGYPAW
jgi:hypothetical protein